MDIHHLRVFASVYKNKSFSGAAEELNLTQPTVSDHIKSVEEELNCRLFDRLSRKIIPTKLQPGVPQYVPHSFDVMKIHFFVVEMDDRVLSFFDACTKCYP